MSKTSAGPVKRLSQPTEYFQPMISLYCGRGCFFLTPLRADDQDDEAIFPS